MLEPFSVPFHTSIKLWYTKALEWSSLVPGPKAKSSSSEMTNLTPSTASYHLGGSSGIFRTRQEHSERCPLCFLSTHVFCFTNASVCLCEWMTHPARSKWRALLSGFMAPPNDWRQSWKREPCRGFIPTCPRRETPNVPARGAARNGRSVWTELPFLGQLFLVPLTIS